MQKCFSSIYVPTDWFCNFDVKDIVEKAVRKLLVKLTKGVNVTNSLRAAFSYKIKCFAQLLSGNSFGLHFFERKLAKRRLENCW